MFAAGGLYAFASAYKLSKHHSTSQCLSNVGMRARLYRGVNVSGVQVLERQLEAGNWLWVHKHAGALLGSFRKASPSRQQQCNRAQLHLLSFSARVNIGKPGPVTNAEQKHIFSGWPYSVNAWSLFSRCGPLPCGAPAAGDLVGVPSPGSAGAYLPRGVGEILY